MKESAVPLSTPLAILTRPSVVLRPDGSHVLIGGRVRPDLSSLAVGLWIGYLFVLFCPGQQGSPALSDRHILQAYGGMMNLFTLVP